MSKFTQKPWTWADRSLLGIDSQNIGIYVVNESLPFSCGYKIGELDVTPENMNEQTANANLIITAPDMREKLDNINEAVKNCGIGGIYDYFDDDPVEAIKQMAMYIKELEDRVDQTCRSKRYEKIKDSLTREYEKRQLDWSMFMED